MKLLDSEYRTSLEEQLLRYQEQLGQEGLDYLSGRGLSPQAVETFRHGRVKDPEPGHEKYEGRLVIPVLKRGLPVDLLFRCISPDCQVNTDQEAHEAHAKVLTTKGGDRWLYNSDAVLDPGQEIDICEGEWDPAILADQVGLAAIGIPGAKQWPKYRSIWYRLLKDFSVIRIWKDPGDAGDQLAEAIKMDLPWARVICPEFDVNKSFQRYGVGYLLEVGRL